MHHTELCSIYWRFVWILDSFTLMYHVPDGAGVAVPLLRKGITWYTDKNVKFHNPKSNSTLQQAFAGTWKHTHTHTRISYKLIYSGVVSGTTNPLYWQRPVYDLDPADPNNNGFINDDLIIWMREAAFPNFKKLYGILNRAHAPFSQGLPAGNYSISISYSILPPQCCSSPSPSWWPIKWLRQTGLFLMLDYYTVITFSFSLWPLHKKNNNNMRWR